MLTQLKNNFFKSAIFGGHSPHYSGSYYLLAYDLLAYDRLAES